MDGKGRFRYMRTLCVFFMLIFAGSLFLSELGEKSIASLKGGSQTAVKEEKEAGYVIVLDAGHGGEDGGAVGVSGVLEKDLNLAIAFCMKEMLEEKGYTVVMTRTEDKLLYTSEQNIKGQRKMYDLRNRLEIASAQQHAILVSIHMNRFGQSVYRGLQVYYGTQAEESRLLATRIQSRVKEDLQPENKRPVKAAGSSIYLLHRAEMPAILIECGFLSNPDECEKLSQKEYQKQLSFSIVCAMIEYMEEHEVTP